MELESNSHNSDDDKVKTEINEETKIHYKDLTLKQFKKENMLSMDDLLESNETVYAIKTEELEIKDELVIQVNYDYEEQLKIKNEESVFSCQKCDVFFSEKMNLDEHVSSFHVKKEPDNESFSIQSLLKAKPYGCDVCFEGLCQKSELKDHSRTHNSASSNDLIGKRELFIDLQRLSVLEERLLKFPATSHSESTNEKPFECDICKKTFKQSYYLKIHKRIHTGEKPYKCDICKRKFLQSGDLLFHKRIHTGETPYECDLCKRRFVKMTYLIRHNRIHTGEKPFGCETCKKRFPRLDTLNKHRMIHTGEKPHKCEVCDKKFISMGEVKKHKRKHSGEKPFGCDVCGKRYTRMDNLNRHKMIHTGEKPHKY